MPTSNSGILRLENARIDDEGPLTSIVLASGRIQSIGPSTGLADGVGSAHDVDGRLVIPAFVNAHTHLDKAFLPSTITGDIAVNGGKVIAPMLAAKRKFNEADVIARARRVVDEAIRTGTTALRTHVDIDPVVGLTSVRALLSLRRTYANLIDIQIVAFPQEGLDPAGQTLSLVEEACRLGVDVVGGRPGVDPDPNAHIDAMFDIATRFDLDVDMHVDIDVDRDLGNRTIEVNGIRYPSGLEVVYLAQVTARYAYAGRVTASHAWGLDSLQPGLFEATLDLLSRAGIAVVSCPSAALYLVGRDDRMRVRRGVTRLRELSLHGVEVAYASDNIGDAFNPYARPDMAFHGLLTAMTSHMSTIDDLWRVIELGTSAPARILRLHDRTMKRGSQPDLIVFDSRSLYDALTTIAPRYMVIRRGKLVAGPPMSFGEPEGAVRSGGFSGTTN